VTRASSRGGQRGPLEPSQRVFDLDLAAVVQSQDSPSGRAMIEGQIARNEPVPGQAFHRSDVARAVAAFHRAFDLPLRVLPSADVGDELAALRVRLLAEELGELKDATATRDIVGIADALADIVYVAYGTAVTYGLDLDAVLAEVHRANMSKLDADGRPVLRADGKVLKSARYRAPDVAGVLAQQLPLVYG
jgi:predicted HAD superfamily Cof-like phosphohydrolase